MFAAHGIPRFGQGEIVVVPHQPPRRLQVPARPDGAADEQRAHLDRNRRGAEAAGRAVAKQWFNRGYYGTMSHNSKAVYQRYSAGTTPIPANLNPLPPEPAAKRYVAAMGGADAVMAQAEKARGGGRAALGGDVAQSPRLLR